MPTPFARVIVRSKIVTAHRIVKTCFTFAAQTPISVFVHHGGMKLLTSNAHPKGPYAAIRVEAHDIKEERKSAVEQEPHAARRARRARATHAHAAEEVPPHTRELAREVREQRRLDERERRE